MEDVREKEREDQRRSPAPKRKGGRCWKKKETEGEQSRADCHVEGRDYRRKR